MSVLDVEIRSARERERDLQRKSYFIGLEMQRKLRIARVVSNDIDLDKRRAEIETRVSLRFKKEVGRMIQESISSSFHRGSRGR